MSHLAPKWVILAPNVPNLGLFKISFSIFWRNAPKYTETDLKKSLIWHIWGSIWPNLDGKRLSLLLHVYRKRLQVPATDTQMPSAARPCLTSAESLTRTASAYTNTASVTWLTVSLTFTSTFTFTITIFSWNVSVTISLYQNCIFCHYITYLLLLLRIFNHQP